MSRLVLRDKVHIDADPEDVWALLEDPEMVKAWNPKLKSVEPISHGPRRIGYQYRAVYEMGGRQNEVTAEIEEYQPPVKLVICERGGRLPPEGRARHEYKLSHRRRGTLLRHKTTLIDSGIPLAVRLLIKFIHVFGRPTGKTYLERLGELAEQNA